LLLMLMNTTIYEYLKQRAERKIHKSMIKPNLDTTQEALETNYS